MTESNVVIREVGQLPAGAQPAGAQPPAPAELVGPPAVNTSEVMATVARMQTVVSTLMLQGADDETIRARVSALFKRFKTSQPFLFEKACKPLTGEDKAILEMMLARVERMKADPDSRHDASVDVGQVLVDKYIRPMVEKMP